MTCFDNISISSARSRKTERLYFCMQYVSETTQDVFEKSNVSNCFVATDQEEEYTVKMHADDPERPTYMIGSVGNPHGDPELFRLLLPIPLAVGNRGTIITLSNAAIRHPYPTFVAKSTNVDGYHVISRRYGAPTFRVGRLMAIAWLPMPADATEVDHIDGNPANDTLENLEWVSHSANLRRGRHTRPRRWAPDDYVLIIHEGCDPLLVHPSMVASITGSRNASHVLRRGTRRSINGWYPCLNPSREEAIAFAENLPFDNIVAYVDAVENLFDSLEMD